VLVDPSHVNWLAVLAAALSSFVLGGLWYSPALFHRPWLAAAGLSEAAIKVGSGRIFSGAFVCALVAAINLAFFLGPTATLGFGVFAGFAAGLGWVATGLTVTFLFERRPLRLIAIDAGYHVVSLTVMGAILGAWR
jgi:Protein of unknown function (DUF1761)